MLLIILVLVLCVIECVLFCGLESGGVWDAWDDQDSLPKAFPEVLRSPVLLGRRATERVLRRFVSELVGSFSLLLLPQANPKMIQRFNDSNPVKITQRLPND